MKHKPDFIDREIGRRLRVARISANIRQYRAAKAVGVTYQQMRKYEVGYNRVSAVIVARLAQVYHRPVGWLGGGGGVVLGGGGGAPGEKEKKKHPPRYRLRERMAIGVRTRLATGGS